MQAISLIAYNYPQLTKPRVLEQQPPLILDVESLEGEILHKVDVLELEINPKIGCLRPTDVSHSI